MMRFISIFAWFSVLDHHQRACGASWEAHKQQTLLHRHSPRHRAKSTLGDARQVNSSVPFEYGSAHTETDISSHPSESLSKFDLVARIQLLQASLNRKQMELEDANVKCNEELSVAKRTQLEHATKQLAELQNYSSTLQLEESRKCAKAVQKYDRELELLQHEKKQMEKNEEDCELQVERWRKVAQEQRNQNADNVRGVQNAGTQRGRLF